MPTPLDSQLQEQVTQFWQQSAAEAIFYQQVAGAVGRERARRDVLTMVTLPTRKQRMGVVARLVRWVQRIRQWKHAAPRDAGTHTDDLVIAVTMVNVGERGNI